MVYTGWISLIVVLGAMVSLLPLHEMPTMLPNANPSEVLVFRWMVLVAYGAIIFVTGFIANREKRPRENALGKIVVASPYTIYFIPLQYWGFIYVGFIGYVVHVWTAKEALSR